MAQVPVAVVPAPAPSHASNGGNSSGAVSANGFVSTGSSSTSTSSGGTVSGGSSTGSPKCSAIEQLKSDTYLKYDSAGDTADFSASWQVQFDTSTCTVSQGLLARDTALPYAPGQDATFRGLGVVKFSGGYVSQGLLAQDTSLPYGPGLYTTFGYSVLEPYDVTVFSGGYVHRGMLEKDTQLTDLSGKTYTYPVGTYATFDSSGHILSAKYAKVKLGNGN